MQNNNACFLRKNQSKSINLCYNRNNLYLLRKKFVYFAL